MRLFLGALFFFFATHQCFALNNGPLVFVIEGQEKQVLDLLNEALNKEFSNGITNQSTDAVGFVSRFDAFFAGSTTIKTNLVPVTKGDSLKPVGFVIGFVWEATKRDPKGYVEDLVKTIKKLALNKTELTLHVDVSKFLTMDEQSKRCFDSLVNDPELNVIKNKVSIDGSEPNFEILANDNFATKEESDAIYVFAMKRNTCLSAVKSLDKYNFNDPSFLLFKSLLNLTEQNILALFKGQLTYAKFAQTRQEINSKYREALKSISDQTKAQDQASKEKALQYALEQQKLLIEQQKIYAQQYRPIINSVPTRQLPTTTNCYFIGNSVTCNTN